MKGKLKIEAEHHISEIYTSNKIADSDNSSIKIIEVLEKMPGEYWFLPIHEQNKKN